MNKIHRTFHSILVISMILLLMVSSLQALDPGSESREGGSAMNATLTASTPAESTPAKTRIRSRSAAGKLKGRHMLACQWVSWDVFGESQVRDESGVWQISGSQHSPDGIDFVKLDGRILEVREKEFDFDGMIEIRVRHIDDGESYIRRGRQTFRISGKRRYWRLVDKQRGPSMLTDYVDIYFR